jgi:hypothetical protein
VSGREDGRFTVTELDKSVEELVSFFAVSLNFCERSFLFGCRDGAEVIVERWG